MVNRDIATSVLAAAILLSLSLPPIYRWLARTIDSFSFGQSSDSLVSVQTFADAALGYFTLLGWPNFLAHALFFGGGLAWWTSRTYRGDEAMRRKTFVRASLAAGVTGGLLIVLLEEVFRYCEAIGRLDLAATLVPGFALLIVVTSALVKVAVLGRAAGDAERAWWATLSAHLTKRATRWTAGMATILYLPGVIFAAGALTRASIASGWLGAGLFGVLLGRHVLPAREGARRFWLTLIATGAARVFFVGLLGASALLVSLLANMPSLTAPGGDDQGPFAYYLQGIEGTRVATVLFLIVGFGVLNALARGLIDVNLFSLDALKAGWLSRRYLGASRPIPAWRARWSEPRDQRVSTGAPCFADAAGEPALEQREADPLTGFAAGDDLPLSALCIGRKSDLDRVYWGPQLLFNTTVTAGTCGGRAGERESFFLSPLYCGSQSLGYARTENARPPGAAGPNLTLGRALAISASAGLSAGALESRPLTALLTVLSARGGWWIEKPRPEGWAAAEPRFGELPLAASLGLRGAAGEFVSLSGGADFDALGVYELIRRRCRYIVAIAAGEAEEGLATLIRRCQIDFGIRIVVGAGPLAPSGTDSLSGLQAVVGEVHYDDVDPDATPGTLIYASLASAGTLSPANERLAAPGTVFDDDRRLGTQAARVVFGEVVARMGEEYSMLARLPQVEYAPRLFTAVVEGWTERARAEDDRRATRARAGSPPPPGGSGRGKGRGRAFPDSLGGAGRPS